MGRRLLFPVAFVVTAASALRFRAGTSRSSTTIPTILKEQLSPGHKRMMETDLLILMNEARALRDQASALQAQLDQEKEERLEKQRRKVDSLIDSLLFHGDNMQSKAQLMHTEEQLAGLLISRRMNFELVNQMFDRIVEQSNKTQSIDSCSPLLSLLLDAACKVDCMEREDNPNKRWNHRVERDLRQKLFLLGYGIKIEDVEKDRRSSRSITGEKDLF
ncbi:hypothetical protein THAOC_21169 [Thalassiosira oceanica]|uniref:Uncharacterized protein n=1 Tax=Thalassiosira oceanica TaxID=159749 RepID=K0S1R7_THAOC|nr:hypothetical protein THAOC_21169 [Thalassiosira oceanica]|eukprot:EJK58684.1 hypothetical protein THAOC_21169 [Thalassiosira oceanica]